MSRCRKEGVQAGGRRGRAALGPRTEWPIDRQAVRPFADERLDYHAHERRQNPEKTQLVRIGAKGGEDTADIGALQRVGNLNPEKAEAQVEHLGEGQVAFVGHFLFKAYVAAYKYKNFYQLYILIRHK